MPLPLQPDLTVVIGPTLTIDDFLTDLIQLKEDGFTHPQLLEWLQKRGVSIAMRTLERRLQLWGSRRRVQVGDLESLVCRVSHHFHHSLLTESQIASRIVEKNGLFTSASQVKEIRLENGWRRRNKTPGADRLATHFIIQDLIQIGFNRIYGRGWAITYFRYKLGYRAR